MKKYLLELLKHAALAAVVAVATKAMEAKKPAESVPITAEKK